MAAVNGGQLQYVFPVQKSPEIQENNTSDNDLITCIERATDLLLLKDFEKCASECRQGLSIAKHQTKLERARKATETLCILWIQAYAELDRWREVLPFITHEYQGIEGCPAKVVQLLVLLHAKVEEFAQCHAIASIWLKTDENHSNSEGYVVLVEAYLTHVLAKQNKWKEMKIFLKSCTSLSAQDLVRLIQLSEQLERNAELKKGQQKESKAVKQRNKKRDHLRYRGAGSPKSTVSEQGTKSENAGNRRHLVTFIHGIGVYISRGFSYINLHTIYKIIFVGMCVYLIAIQGNMGDMISNMGRVGQLGQALKRVLSSLL